MSIAQLRALETRHAMDRSTLRADIIAALGMAPESPEHGYYVAPTAELHRCLRLRVAHQEVA